jgi:hypothetical protein
MGHVNAQKPDDAALKTVDDSTHTTAVAQAQAPIARLAEWGFCGLYENEDGVCIQPQR